MKKWKTRGISLLLALVLITGGTTAAFPGQSFAENVEIESPAACLMELTTGKILYEKEADTRRSPASVTKIMTTLLIMPNPWAARRYFWKKGKNRRLTLCSNVF